MPIDPKSVEPRSALSFLASGAVDGLRLRDRDQFDAAVQRLAAIVDDYLAREAIAADKAKQEAAPAAQ